MPYPPSNYSRDRDIPLARARADSFLRELLTQWYGSVAYEAWHSTGRTYF